MIESGCLGVNIDGGLCYKEAGGHVWGDGNVYVLDYRDGFMSVDC